MSGRHAAPVGRSFYRDLATMVAGIVVVGAIVYGLLWFFNSRGDTTSSTTAPSAAGATTTEPVSTTRPAPSTTARPTTTAAPTTTTVAIRTPNQVRVLVLNAVGVTGLAADATAALEALGYQVLTPSNYQPALEQTRIWFVPTFEAEAFELAGAAFPDGLVEQNPELDGDADIVVVLGASYQP